MTDRSRALRLLINALEGEPPADSAWTSVIELANRGWLVPALHVSLRRSGRLADIPEPVRDYLALLHERNLHRNQRLRNQLVEAVQALNANGVTPVLLKGAIFLCTGAAEKLGGRMISDLDLSINEAENDASRAALAQLGYRPTARSNEVGRPTDVGTIELHTRANSRGAPYLRGDLRACSEAMDVGGATVLIPSVTSRAIHLIVHDMLKEGDYWRLTLDLRHLDDLVNLARSTRGIDWDEVLVTLNDRIGRRAVELQAVTLNDLYGVSVPPALCTRRARAIHHVRLAATSGSVGGALLRTLGRLAWGVHRMRAHHGWQGGTDFLEQLWRALRTPAKGSRL